MNMDQQTRHQHPRFGVVDIDGGVGPAVVFPESHQVARGTCLAKASKVPPECMLWEHSNHVYRVGRRVAESPVEGRENTKAHGGAFLSWRRRLHDHRRPGRDLCLCLVVDGVSYLALPDTGSLRHRPLSWSRFRPVRTPPASELEQPQRRPMPSTLQHCRARSRQVARLSKV